MRLDLFKFDWAYMDSELLIFLCRRFPAANIVLVLDSLSTILLAVVHCATLPTSA